MANICCFVSPASIPPFSFGEHPSPTLVQMGLTHPSSIKGNTCPQRGQSDYSITLVLLIGSAVDTGPRSSQ